MQKPAPQPVAQQQQKSGGMFSGLGSTLMQGMAFGAGSEVAHQAIRSVIGSGSSHNSQEAPVQQQQQIQPQQCGEETNSFSNCLRQHTELSMCQSYMDMLKECQRKNNF
ncbi:hypothetical protein IMG5_195270 [Ichthyophthirius multifiliis]|uniref:CHCH domain protein n=1 Tax=Ichthyophthirius multifiliis TaxID=5932 RepID=G0R4X0_ICHMU|nr:hypothetical protein IMG5_195270 [Ichthyophthirius multifiliis]EGR27480.1 hypothetical protein IMG5_195270 [Ichthyophthirius multifiliis]|eukprot:XP_004024390.1 hypothetical protein IMG5_195270 [Ichthyophthirius multifiliis]